MTERELKSIKFAGIDGVFTIPQVSGCCPILCINKEYTPIVKFTPYGSAETIDVSLYQVDEIYKYYKIPGLGNCKVTTDNNSWTREITEAKIIALED